MDRLIEKKQWTTQKVLVLIGIVLLFAIIAASIYFSTGKSSMKVALDRITVHEVKLAPFQESVSVNGVVMPVSTIYLDAAEGGRVEEIFVEDGTMMQKGQSIMRLSNTDLELQLANQETQVFNVLTQMQISRNNAAQNTIRQLNQMADVDNALQEAERIYLMNKKLFEEKVIGAQEFKSAENLYRYQQRRRTLTANILAQDSGSLKLQYKQDEESFAHMKRTLALMRQKVEELVVKSPVDGQLTSLDAEIGQTKNKGQRLGQLDVTNGFKVRADIDEHYIARIFTGLKGRFTFAGKDYMLVIKKVYTQVTNGRFQVDLGFEDTLPPSIRRGQSLQIRLSLSDEAQALLVPRGGFYQQTGGNWIYKLNKNGTVAYRVDIQLNRQNPDFYEITQGLNAGDRVITSSYENYGSMQELILKTP